MKAKWTKFTAGLLAMLIAIAFVPALFGGGTVLAAPTYTGTVIVNVATYDSNGNLIGENGGNAGVYPPGIPSGGGPLQVTTGDLLFVFASPQPGYVLQSVIYGNGETGGKNITKDMQFTVEGFQPVIDISFKKQDNAKITLKPGTGGTGTTLEGLVESGKEMVLDEDLPDGWTAPSGMHLIGWNIEDVAHSSLFYQAGAKYKVISEATLTAVYGEWITGWEDTGEGGINTDLGVGCSELGILQTGSKVPCIPGESQTIDIYLKDGYTLKDNKIEIVGASSNTVLTTMTMTADSNVSGRYYGKFTMPKDDVILRFATTSKSSNTSPDPVPDPVLTTPTVTSGVAHVQDIGDVSYTVDSSGVLTIGTRGMGKRLEEITINLQNTTGLTGTLEYRVHVQDIGWMPWVQAGQKCGTEGQAKRIEAIEIRLTGELADLYSVQYCVHIQDYGDMQGWVHDGALAGTTGESKRIEELQIKIVPIGTDSTMSVKYRVHVQDYGWEGSYASDGAMSGTSGQAKRLEGIEIFLEGCQCSGGIKYKTHVQDYGWETNWSYDGEMSGTQGQSKRLEGICIELYGEVALYYDVYYRVHAQDIGWLSWAANGDYAGTAGRSARLEAIQIVLVPKGGGVPSNDYKGITSVDLRCFVEGYDEPVG